MVNTIIPGTTFKKLKYQVIAGFPGTTFKFQAISPDCFSRSSGNPNLSTAPLTFLTSSECYQTYFSMLQPFTWLFS